MSIMNVNGSLVCCYPKRIQGSMLNHFYFSAILKVAPEFHIFLLKIKISYQQQEQKWSEFFQRKKSETQKQEVTSKDSRSDYNVDFNFIKITSSFVLSIQGNRDTRNQLTIETYY